MHSTLRLARRALSFTRRTLRAFRGSWRTLIEPEEQCVHSLGPARAATLPASQSVHALEPALDMDPAPRSIQLVAPGRVDALPASQFVHAMLAIWSEYVPLVRVRIPGRWPPGIGLRHTCTARRPGVRCAVPCLARQASGRSSARKSGTHRVRGVPAATEPARWAPSTAAPALLTGRLGSSGRRGSALCSLSS